MVRLLDTTQENPGCASAPSLPQALVAALDAQGLDDAPDLCDVVVEGRGRLITEDIQTDPRWADLRDVAMEYGLRSCWTEPIPAPDGRILGAFVLYSEQARGPDPSEIRVMETAARLVGIAREQEEAQRAIQRAYQTLERRVAERTRELATLNAVAAVASRSLNIEQILESALDETTGALGLEAGTGYRLDDAGRTLRAVTTRGLSAHFADVTESVQLAAALLVQPLAPDQLQVFRIADYPDRPIKQEMLDEGLELLVGIPLAAKGRLVGLLALATRHPRELTAEEQTLLLAVGQQVGVAIENANLYAAEQRRRHVAEGLRETLTVLNSRQSLPDTLDHIVDQAQRLMECDAVALMRQQEKDGPLLVQASKGLDEDFIAALRVPYGTAASGRAIAERQPVAVSDTAVLAAQLERDGSAPSLLSNAAILRQLGLFRAMLAVPLIIRNEAYGAISLYFRQKREFSEEDQRQAAAMADQAALAIESSRLRDQAGVTAAIEERTRLARELHDSVTQSLYSVTLYAEAAARLVESGNIGSAAGYLREVRDTAQEALREMRLLIFQLRPPALEEVGLAGALQARLQGVEARGGIDPDLLVTGEEYAARMPLSVQADLYAIVQEALNNCLKHAQAAHVWVTLEFREDDACASVRDDGAGFDVSDGMEAGGMGLHTMQERVDRIGGTLTIESAPGMGTTVRVDVPHLAG
jgi:signal transduction histidine kinase